MTKQHNYNPLKFFALAFAISWGFWALSGYHSAQEGGEVTAFLFNFLGLIGPCVAALVLTFSSGDPALKKDFKSRFRLRLLNGRALAFIFLVPPAVVYFSTWVSTLLGKSADQFQMVSDPSELIPMIIVAIILAPTIEELGWRGYGMDSLRSKFGTLKASILFSIIWSLWHAPLVSIHGTYHYELLNMDTPVYLINFFASVIPAGVLANYIYYRCNRSIVSMMMFHAALNWMAISLASEQFTKVIITIVYTVVAIAVLTLDRKAFGDGPRNFVGDKA